MISLAIYKCRRAELERWIDSAIALLDDLDDDSDLEDDEVEDIDERELPYDRIAGGIGA